jgi:hypothetical protein
MGVPQAFMAGRITEANAERLRVLPDRRAVTGRVGGAPTHATALATEPSAEFCECKKLRNQIREVD